MTTPKQVQMTMHDMLFITWAVKPERVRKLVDDRLDLDTLNDASGSEAAFVSAVCFKVADVRSSVFPISILSFAQVNWRTYVRARGVPAVCFLDVKVSSRTITALTSFLRVPVHYEDINITAATQDVVRYTIASDGLTAEAIAGERAGSSEPAIASADFITNRLVGYAGSGDSMFKIEVFQPGLETVPARIVRIEPPRLEKLGVLDEGQASKPVSALYVREAAFQADTPTRESF